MNNAPTGAGSAAPVGFDRPLCGRLKASPEQRPFNEGQSRCPTLDKLGAVSSSNGRAEFSPLREDSGLDLTPERNVSPTRAYHGIRAVNSPGPDEMLIGFAGVGDGGRKKDAGGKWPYPRHQPKGGVTSFSSSLPSSSPRSSPPFGPHDIARRERFYTASIRVSSMASNVLGPTFLKRLSRFREVATEVSGVFPLI